ncbi:LamG-like jellyroll fold domain-containing protein [Galbibacter mesophilus]|uniref:LamG-like jellyroll fold domain-containing protein n=1 Tax=Galbibacter mesophilus TaxID=379069 RepID=UPI00191D5639|nr:LamG-like jellyroll fold domain-containing protein [Galbibacter mesophilus]MCM5663883.1 T9SS type A sorting domain-containing protein [Galbibacter mesophilus]
MKTRLLHQKILLLLLIFANVSVIFSQDRKPIRNVIYPEAAFAVFDADTNRLATSGRIIDVTRPPFNAAGDGITDDTEAINAAYTFVAERMEEFGWQSADSNNGSYQMYFPNGTYLVSNTIIHNLGNITYTGKETDPEGVAWVRFVGQNRDNTIIKLQDNAPGFGAGAQKELISLQKKGVGDREGNNIPAANQISDITIDTGSGNPGAIGVYWMSANTGEMDNVLIKSGDGQGYAGIDMPVFTVQGHYRDITIDGFDYGIASTTRGESNPTYEYITFRNQNIAAVLAEDGSPIFRKAASTNDVPFVIISQDESQIIIIDSQIEGTNSSVPAIDLQNEKSQLFIRNTTFSGYSASVRKEGENVVSGNVEEYVWSDVYTLFEGFEKKSLNLPIAESPIMEWESDLSQWANVDEYPGETDAERVQNAMNSGKPVVYFPKHEYNINTRITIPASVKFIDFMYSRPSNNTDFDIFESSSDMLYIYHINRGSAELIQSAARPVVMRNVTWNNFKYTGTGTSTMYLESTAGFGSTVDFCPTPLTIYGRSINDENKGTSNFKVFGGTLWTMGFKTESETVAFEVRDGGFAEVLGGFRNEVGKKAEEPFVLNDNSNVSFIGYNHLSGSGDPIITEIQDGIEQTILRTQLPARGSGAVMVPLYVGTTDAEAPACLPPLGEGSETSTDSATIFWSSPNPTVDTFEVRYKTINATDFEVFEVANDTTATLTNLIEGVNYEWQVRAKCGEDFSEYSAPELFTTDLTVNAIDAPITIDGILDESVWNLNTDIAKVISGEGNNTGVFGVLWDNNYLYVGVRVLDDNLVNDSDDVFQDDAVEIYIDPENDGGSYGPFDFQLIKGYNDEGLFSLKPFNGEILHKTTNIDGGYVVEMAIPWSGLGTLPGNNKTIGLDVGFDDDDDGDNRDAQALWSGIGTNFRDTSEFGDVILKNGVATETSLGLHFTWDGITTDEVVGLNSTLSEFASFTADAAIGSGSISILDEAGQVAIDPAVAIAKGSLLNESFTARSYSLWFKAKDTQPKQVLLEEGGEGAGVAFELENDMITVLFRHGTGDNFSTVSVPFSNGDEIDWNHLAVTFEAGLIGVYLNGELAGSGVGSVATIPNHNNATSLGGVDELESSSNGDNFYFNGSLDEFKVFNGVLTSEEIVELADRPVILPSATLGLHFTWDNKTADEIASLESGLQDGLVSFSAESPFGSAGLEFTGNDILADTPAVGVLGGSMLNDSFSFRSYSLWFKPRNTTAQQLLFEEGGDQGGAVFQIQEGNVMLMFRHGGGNNFTSFEVPLPSYSNGAEWTHLAVTYAAGTITAYINGQEAGKTISVVGSIPAHRNAASLGGNKNVEAPTNDNTFYYDGFLDEFKVYDGILTEEEIQVLFDELFQEAGINLHWTFNETTGTVVDNVSGPGNDGTIQGGTAENITSEGIVGTSFLFDPVSPSEGEVVVLEKQLINNYPMSASMWVNASNSQFSQVMTLSDSTTNRNHISIGITDLTLDDGSKGLRPFILVDDNDGKPKRVNSEENIAGGWHFITLVLESATSRRLYVDGKVVASDTAEADNITFQNQRLTVGASIRGSFNGNRYKGKVDEFKLFNTTLTEAEIEAERVAPLSIATVDTLSVEVNAQNAIPTPIFVPNFSKTAVTFTSNNPEIATVDENGLVTGISSGTAIIEVASQFNPEAKSTVEVTVEGGLSLGDCEFEISDFVGATEIVAINEVTYRSFERNKGTYVIGIAAGIRTDGQAGAWEIHSDCSVKTIRRTGQGDNTTLLPDVKGVEKYRGWNYVPTSISEDGQFIYATAINQNGFTHKRGWTVEAGTEVEVRFQLGGAFYGRIFGISSEILCDDLNVETFAGNYFVTGCNDGSEMFSTQSASSNETLYQVYPNPVNNSFSLKGTSEANNLNLQVFDLTGNLVLSTLVGTSQSIDATRLNPGVYLVKIYQDSEEIVQTKLVKK